MIRVTCDGCDKAIDRDNERWFGVDLTEAPPSDEPDEDGYIELREISVTTEHANHFCSPECLSSWAFAQSLEPST